MAGVTAMAAGGEQTQSVHACDVTWGQEWVPGRLIGLGVRSFRLKILQQNPIFVMNCEK